MSYGSGLVYGAYSDAWSVVSTLEPKDALHGSGFLNTGGGGGSWLADPAFDALTATAPALRSFVATDWLTPTTPATTPASEAGMERALLARCTATPFTLYVPRVVPKARSTCAAVPVAAMNERSAGTAPTLKPSDGSQVSADADRCRSRRETGDPLRLGHEVAVLRRTWRRDRGHERLRRCCIAQGEVEVEG